MYADARNLSTAPTNLTPPGGPGLAPAEGGMPVVVNSKSSETLIRSYGRGKGLSIAAPCNNTPGQKAFLRSLRHAATRDHLGSHLGVNRGSFRRRTPSESRRASHGGGSRRG